MTLQDGTKPPPPAALPGLAAAPAWLRRRMAGVPGLHTSSAGAFAVLVGGAGISYLAQVGTARILGVDGFGIYAYAFAWTTLLAYLSTLGFHVSLLRLAPTYLAHGDIPHLRGLLRFATAGTAAAGLALAAAGSLVLLVAGASTGDAAVPLLIGLAVAPLLALQLVGAAAARAFGSVVAALAPERLGRDAIAVALLAALVWAGLAPPAASTAMLAMLASAVVTLGLVTLLVREVRPTALRSAGPVGYQRGAWLRPVMPLTLIMAADVVMGRSGVIVLGIIGNTAGAGVFAAAFAIATLVALPRMAVAAVFAPTVAGLHARGDQAGLQELSARAARLSLAGATLVAIPVSVGAPQLLALFGPDFTTGSAAVLLLVFGQLAAAAAGPQQHILTMTGREPAAAGLQGTAALAAFALCFALAPGFGVDGAAAAVAAAVVLWNLGMAWFVWTRLGLRPGLLARTRRTLTDS